MRLNEKGFPIAGKGGDFTLDEWRQMLFGDPESRRLHIVYGDYSNPMYRRAKKEQEERTYHRQLEVI